MMAFGRQSLNLSGSPVATHVVIGYVPLPCPDKFRSTRPNVDATISERTRPDSLPLPRARRRLWVSGNSPLLAEQAVSMRRLDGIPSVFLMVDDVVRRYGFEPIVAPRWRPCANGSAPARASPSSPIPSIGPGRWRR